MHVIFRNITGWQIPFVKMLKYFIKNIYYIHIDEKTKHKKDKIALKLKSFNILPLPLEFEKTISPDAGFSITDSDPNEKIYEKNKDLLPEKSLKKYCKLFLISENETKKIRLLIQDFLSIRHISTSGIISIWSNLYPSQKIFYVSFNFSCFYNTNPGKNVFKIIIPIDIFYYFTKILLKIVLFFFRIFYIKKEKNKDQFSNFKDFDEIQKKDAAIITHRGTIYGAEKSILFEKSLYYSNNLKSSLNKQNILHIDYSNFPSPDKNIYWVCLKKMKISNAKIFFKLLIAMINTFYLVRNWNTLLGWILCIQQYNTYIKYLEVIKKFKNLKIALIDYDCLCPKTLILALEKKNIRTIATQERFIHTFYKSFANIMVDTYFVASKFVANFIKDSKYHHVKNIITVGLHRSDHILMYKKDMVPDEIANAKKAGKKILVVLGFQSSNNWFDSHTNLILNWSAQVRFLEDIIKLSENLKNTFIVVRYKRLYWTKYIFFNEILKKISNNENIVISNNYTPLHSYKLCAHADLIIGKHTSLCDECLSREIPVLFYDYTHNMKKIISDTFDYDNSSLMCYNFEELLERSKLILMQNSDQFKKEIKLLKDKFYYLDKESLVKNKILEHLEKSLDYSYSNSA